MGVSRAGRQRRPPAASIEEDGSVRRLVVRPVVETSTTFQRPNWQASCSRRRIRFGSPPCPKLRHLDVGPGARRCPGPAQCRARAESSERRRHARWRRVGRRPNQLGTVDRHRPAALGASPQHAFDRLVVDGSGQVRQTKSSRRQPSGIAACGERWRGEAERRRSRASRARDPRSTGLRGSAATGQPASARRRSLHFLSYLYPYFGWGPYSSYTTTTRGTTASSGWGWNRWGYGYNTWHDPFLYGVPTTAAVPVLLGQPLGSGELVG